LSTRFTNRRSYPGLKAWVGSGVLLAMASLGLLLASGCKNLGGGALKEREKLKRVITIHTFTMSPTRYNEVNRMAYAHGRYFYPESHPSLSSKDIANIEVLDRDDGEKALRCELDSHGYLTWARLSAEMQGQHLALLLDGKFRGFLSVPHASSLPYFDLAGPFTAEEAKEISENAPKNYSNPKRK
jgi:preprotein translocase subunit SecD